MDNFGSQITEWTKNELDIKQLQNKINEKKQTNKQISEKLLEHIEQEQLNDNIFKLSSLQKDVCVRKIKTSDSLTFKFLEYCLQSYFQENSSQSNEYHLQNIISFIKQKRTTKVKKTLEIIKTHPK
jgi:hypothetical protein